MFRSRFLAAASSLFLLAACSSDDSTSVTGGYVVADEPLAAQAGAQVLSAGGSAADAAAAMYFVLSVTYPVAAGLGGGGLCVVHDPVSRSNEAFDFLARNTSTPGAYGVPGNVRGFSALQSAYGRLPWQRVVAPAQAYAATGFPISQALAARLAPAQNVIRLDANLAAEFLDESGQVKKAGTVVVNSDLAGTLSAIRQHGPEGFYQGSVAQALVAYSTSANGTLSAADLAGYGANRDEVQTVQVGDQVAYLPPDRVGAGAFTGALLNHLADTGGDESAPISVGGAVKAALDQYGITSLPQDLGATGFVAADASGEAVSCAVTMNGPFGSGHTAQGTGVVLPRAPASSQEGLSAAFLSPLIATDSDGDVTLAGAGAGGPNATASVAYALVKLARGDDMTLPGSLRATGTEPFETVNVIACQGGSCATLPDPKASGSGQAAGD